MLEGHGTGRKIPKSTTMVKVLLKCEILFLKFVSNFTSVRVNLPLPMLTVVYEFILHFSLHKTLTRR